jgi:hypothetical protein
MSNEGKTPDNGAEAWRLDRKVPLTFVVMLAGNLLAGIWFAAQSSHTQADHARRIAALEARADSQSRELQQLLLELRERMARIEARLEAISRENANRTAVR